MNHEIDAKDVFRLEDFQSITLIIRLQNFTTKTEVVDRAAITLVEVGDHCLIFDMPTTACNIKHSVMISIMKLLPGAAKPEPLLNLTGKIAEVNLDDYETRMRATVELVQYDDQSLDELIALFTQRQQEINAFMAAAKGM